MGMALATLAQAKVSAVQVGSFLKMKEIIPVHLNQTTRDSDKKISNMEGVDIDIQDATIYGSDVIPIQHKADVKVEMDVNELTTNNLDIDNNTYNVKTTISPQLEGNQPILKRVNLKIVSRGPCPGGSTSEPEY